MLYLLPEAAVSPWPDLAQEGHSLISLRYFQCTGYEGVALERAEYEADEYERLQVTVQLVRASPTQRC